MHLISALYVSRKTFRLSESIDAIDDILKSAVGFNRSVDVTGALLYTGTHFAQVLEGSAADVDHILEMVAADPRHTDFSLMDRSHLIARRFPQWSMAYCGPSKFVLGFVTRLLNVSSSAQEDLCADWLTSLMNNFIDGPSASDSCGPLPRRAVMPPHNGSTQICE